MRELTVEAKIENLDTVLDFVSDELESAGCSMKLQTQIGIAAEEVFVNIAHYAYSPGDGTVVIRTDVCDGFTIEFEDGGKAYNPLEKQDPVLNVSAMEREIGGLGIFMVKELMDWVEYSRVNDKNLLKLRKNFS
jgi:anti-sigma regulatory factor (Ser/Thr protein kinase)